jgi:hypothetical protein
MAKPYTKHYESKEYLTQMVSEGKTSKEIGKDNHVSYKLINHWLITHGLIRKTTDIRLP